MVCGPLQWASHLKLQGTADPLLPAHALRDGLRSCLSPIYPLGAVALDDNSFCPFLVAAVSLYSVLKASCFDK